MCLAVSACPSLTGGLRKMTVSGVCGGPHLVTRTPGLLMLSTDTTSSTTHSLPSSPLTTMSSLPSSAWTSKEARTPGNQDSQARNVVNRHFFSPIIMDYNVISLDYKVIRFFSEDKPDQSHTHQSDREYLQSFVSSSQSYI